MVLLTFIIPVRHPDNALDWQAVISRLKQTMSSIAGQTVGDWRAVIVANECAVLPKPPPGFTIERVAFAPNPMHHLPEAQREPAYHAFRLDKGRRVLKGMLAAPDSHFFMIVDDDDLVNARLVEHASRYPEENGWTINSGYLWSEGSKIVFRHNNFSKCCGTSHIVRSDHYQLPKCFEDASNEYVATMLGSHIQIEGILASRGTPLGSLPFRGAVYRVGHPGAHSHSGYPLSNYLLKASLIKSPRTLLRNLTSFGFAGLNFRRDFFG